MIIPSKKQPTGCINGYQNCLAHDKQVRLQLCAINEYKKMNLWVVMMQSIDQKGEVEKL